MKFTALGGAMEVGASSYLIEIDGKRILIDCGLRIYVGNDKVATVSNVDLLPMFDMAGNVDAICVTHAHIDHIGALIEAMRRFPKAFIFMTVPTFPLTVTMLLDMIKRVERDYGQTHPFKNFSEDTLERLADRVLTVKFRQTFRPFSDSSLSVTFFCAGHILGAAGIFIEGKEGTVFFTGDFSLAAERTVPGADFAVGNNVDLLVIETTYGDQFHSDRLVEEKKLAGVVSSALTRGGKVLIPSFALSKAQEIILTLQDSQASGAIPPVPIFVDGMVRDVCDFYEDMVQDGLFFRRDLAAPVIRVDDPETRRFVLAGSPCIVVASSGRLIGGPSVSYAKELLPDVRSAILFVSYQDEESPGHKIANMKSGDRIILDGEEIRVNANVECFNFSAHADQSQLLTLAKMLRPRSVICVHGEPDSSLAFTRHLIQSGYSGRIAIPANGEEIVLFDKSG